MYITIMGYTSSIMIILLLCFGLHACERVNGLERLMSRDELREDERNLVNSLTIFLRSKNGITSSSSLSTSSIFSENFQLDNSMLVMENGEIDMKWSSNCHKSILLKKCRHYTFDMYTDEITFEFSFVNISDMIISSSTSVMSRFMQPSIRSMHGRSKPEVNDFSYDEQNNIGEIHVWHNCQARKSKKGREDLSIITLSFSISSRIAIRLTWQKVCGNGLHHRLDYGYFSDHSSSLASSSFPVSLRHSKNHQHTLVFGPRILSTRLFLHLKQGANSQHFTHTSVFVEEILNENDLQISNNNDKDDLNRDSNEREPSVELRGPINGGMLKRDIDTTFDIIYSCTGPGLWNVYFSISIPPFDKVEMKWRKDCGGGTERNIAISNHGNDDRYNQNIRRFKNGDIVRSGKTLAAYSSNLSYEQTLMKGAVWYAGRGNRIFLLLIDGRRSKSGEGGIEIGETVANSEDERIGLARILDSTDYYQMLYSTAGASSGSRFSNYKTIPDNGEVITKRVKRIIRVRVDCLKRGWIRVAVRISIRDRNPIEWWFWNQCTIRKSYRNRRLTRAIWQTGFVMCLFFLGVFFFLKRVHSLSDSRKHTILHSRYKGPLGTNRFRTVYPDDPRTV